ncbi:MAG: ABC transporter substrate-binding protein, partial [Stellaceae bacterium]
MMRKIGLVVAALISAATSSALADAPLDHVSLRYGFIATGIDSVWTYGIEQHIFANKGIALELRQGKGSAVTAQTVAAGTDDFGVDVDGGTFLTLAAKGLPATAILANAATSPLVVFSPKDKPLKTPADLIGKKIAITAGDGPSALLPALLERNHVDQSKITLINMQPGPKLTSLLSGRVDGVATNYTLRATLAAKGMPTYALMYADFGVVTPGMYLVASNAFLKAHPQLVQRFVAAAQEAMAATEKNPEAAAQSFSRVYPAYNKEGALGETKLLIQLFRSKDTEGKPLGTVSLADAEAGAKVLTAAGLMPANTDVT